MSSAGQTLSMRSLLGWPETGLAQNVHAHTYTHPCMRKYAAHSAVFRMCTKILRAHGLDSIIILTKYVLNTWPYIPVDVNKKRSSETSLGRAI